MIIRKLLAKTIQVVLSRPRKLQDTRINKNFPFLSYSEVGKVVINYKGLARIKSHNPLNTWSHEVM